MTTKKNRIKKPAVTIVVPQTREQVSHDILQIGIKQRERARLETAMNDEMATIKKKFEDLAAVEANAITALSQGVQLWCEANRAEITNNNKQKFANLGSGQVNWRTRPASVKVTDEENVIEELKKANLHRFIRTKDSVNKEAILADQFAVAGIAGIKLSKDKEDFVIEPFEAKLEEVAQ